MDDWVQIDLIDELNSLLRHMPRARSGRFVAPAETELEAFRGWVASLAGGYCANRMPSVPSYELLHIIDGGDHNQPNLLVREPAPPGRLPYALGWGMYLLRPEAEKNTIIEVPHPLHDEGTGQLGLVLYRRLSARALLLAGAHRHANPHNLADPAHNPQTIFHAVHQALVGLNHPVVVQLHGFSAQKHPDYPQAIIGGFDREAIIAGSESQTIIGGADHPIQPFLERLADAFSAAGVSVGLCPDHRWQNLCGRTNVQATAMPQGIFVHLELSEDLRQPASPLPDIFQAVLG